MYWTSCYSNTTYVNVKHPLTYINSILRFNSNTTYVNVKLLVLALNWLWLVHSNTTYVNVKHIVVQYNCNKEQIQIQPMLMLNYHTVAYARK